VGDYHRMIALGILLVRTLGDTAVVAVQNPVQLSEDTEPEPDLAVLLPRYARAGIRHALPIANSL